MKLKTMFVNNNVEINGKVGVKSQLSFFYKGDKKIIDISAGCGCTKTNFENGILNVEFTPFPAPVQLPFYPYKTTKTIIITYEDYSTENINFTATVNQ